MRLWRGEEWSGKDGEDVKWSRDEEMKRYQ